MPCFVALAPAFRGSHSNTHLVYTKCTDPLDPGLRAATSIGFVSELCHMPAETPGRHRDLRGHADAPLKSLSPQRDELGNKLVL